MGSKVDIEEAQRLLDEGKSVRDVAISQGVSTQRVYQLIYSGRLTRPDQDSPES